MLVCLRREGDYWGGWWEFPGGKREPGETIADCIARELREELGIDVIVVDALPVVEHLYADRNRLVRLHPHVCRLAEGSAAPAPLQVQEARWCTPAEAAMLRFLPANGPLLRSVGAYRGTPELANAPETATVTGENSGV